MSRPVLGFGQVLVKNRLYRAIFASRRYYALVLGLGVDIFKKYPSRTIKIIVSSALSLAFQLLALGLLFRYVGALESNELFYGFTPRTSIGLFALVTVATAIFFFGFAALEYRANLAIIALCRRYQKQGVQEALAISSKLPHWFQDGSSDHISGRHLRQILSVDVSHRSRMARLLMRAFIPFVRLILSAAVVLYLNLQFSLLIFVVIGIPIAGLYLVGKRIADTITSRETGPQSAYREQSELLSRSWEAKTHIVPDEITRELALGGADSQQMLYYKRLRAKIFGQLLINAANTLGIMVLVLSLGYWMLQEGQTNWSVWLTYLIALRYFLSSLTRVAQAIIQSARFSRQVRRFTEFLAAGKVAAHSPDPLAVPCPPHVISAYRGNSNGVPDDDDFEDEDG